MDRLLRAIAALVTARPRGTILVALILTLPVGYLATRLHVSTSRTALVSDDEPHWQRYMAFAKEFGIPEDLVVVAKSDDPAAVRSYLDGVAAQLVDDPHVGPVFHRIDLRALEVRAPLFLDEAALSSLEALAKSPPFGRLVAADDPGTRLAALAGVLDELPTQIGVAVTPAETTMLATSLEGLFEELARITEGGDGPISVLDERALFRASSHGRRQGIDADGYLTAKEGRVGIMFVRPTYTRDEIEAVRPFVETVRSAAERVGSDHPSVKFGLTGIPASQIDELTSIARDTILTTAIALVGVVILFLLYFPAIRILVFALVPIAFGVLWTAATIYLSFGYVNLMSSIFLVVLIGMGIDFSVHIVSRFLEERKLGAAVDNAARLAVERAGRGVVTGGVTSAGAFAAVGWSGFKGIEELGFAAAIGLVFTLVFTLVLLPALLTLGGEAVDISRRRRFGIAPAVDLVLNHRVLVFALAAVITVPSLIWANQTPFDFSLLNILPKDAESAVLMAEMIEDRELSANAVAIVADNLEEARVLTSTIGELDRVYSVVSAASFIPPNQAGRLERLRAIDGTMKAARQSPASEVVVVEDALDALETMLERISELAFAGGHKEAVDRMSRALDALDRVRARLSADPEAAAKRLLVFDRAFAGALAAQTSRIEQAVAAGLFTPDDLPKNLRRRFVSEAGRFAVYAVPRDSIWDRPQLGRFLEDIRAIAPEVTGFPETFYENADRIRQGFLRAALYAAVAVVVLLMIDLRRPRDVALAMVPVVLGAVWMLGAMHLLNVPYNLANIVGLPLVIGVGIDNGVHIIHRFRECSTVRLAAVETGGAVTLSSLTTMVGFGSLAFASHRGYASLGQILFIGVGACLVATLTVLLVTLGRNKGPTA